LIPHKRSQDHNMSILRRRSTLPVVAPPLEDDDLLPEILLRLSPNPSSIPRALIAIDGAVNNWPVGKPQEKV
jgi:hypothetical protein